MDQLVGTFPDYISEDKLKSNNLVNYLSSDDRLNYLRRLYVDDVDKFYDVRDELLLRGMRFNTKLAGNFFPKQKFEPTLIIYVKDNNKKFESIDENILDIHQLSNRFQFKNDVFFDGISIEGLADFFDKKVSLIKLAFDNAGFKILSIDEYKSKNDNSMIAEPQMGSIDQPKKVISNKLDDLNEELNSSKFRLFMRYLAELGVHNIYELNSQIVDGYRNYRGVGIGRFNDVNDLWERIQRELKQQLVSTTDNIDENLNAIVNNKLRTFFERFDYSYIEFLDKLYGIDEKDSDYDWENNKKEIEKNFKIYLTNHLDEIMLKVKRNKRVALLDRIKNGEIYDSIHDMEVSYIFKEADIKVDSSQVPINITLADFIKNEKVTNDLLDEIDNKINSFKSLNHIMDDFTNSISQKDLEISLLRNKGLTLQEIGVKKGVTRERIRQIDKRTVQKLNGCLNKTMSFFLDYLFSKYSFVKINNFEQYFNLSKTYVDLVNIYLDSSDEIFVDKSYVFTNEFNQKLEKVKKKIKQNRLIVLKDEDVYEILSNHDEYELNHDFVNYIMKSLNYVSRDGFYVDEKARLTDSYTYIFKYFIHNSLIIDKTGYEIVRKIYEKYFVREFPNNVRALTSALDRAKNIIEINSFEYRYFDFEQVDQVLLQEIKNKLDDELEISDVINGKSLFDKYEEIWEKYGITTPLFLYKIIRNYYSDDYNIGRGNTLEISSLDTRKIVKHKRLEEYLIKKAKPVTKKEILNDLHWKDYTLDQMADKSTEIISVKNENNEACYQMLSLYRYTDEDKNNLKSYVLNYMGNKRYIWIYPLYKKILFEDIGKLITVNKLEEYELSSVIKNLLPGLKGYEQFLAYDDFSLTSNELLVSMLDNTFSKNDIKELMDPKGYSPQSISSFPKKLIDNGYAIKYDFNEYIKIKSLNINDFTLKEIQDFLNELFKDKWYIPVTDVLGVNDLSDSCPDGVEMTPVLLVFIANKYLGYQYFYPFNFMNASQFILVDKSRSINNYAELVYRIMLEQGLQNESFTQGKFIRYLNDKHLYNGNNFPNAISMSHFFNISDIGIITLKRENES